MTPYAIGRMSRRRKREARSASTVKSKAAPGAPSPARNALRFVLIAGVLFALYSFPYAESGFSERLMDRYLAGYAELVGAFLGWFEAGVSVDGNTVLGRASLQIVKSCDAMEANILFAAAVLAFPAPVARKIVALAAGVLAITCVNVLRISALYYVLVHRPRSFEFWHLELWPLLMIATSVVLFFGSTRFLLLKGRKRNASEGHALA